MSGPFLFRLAVLVVVTASLTGKAEEQLVNADLAAQRVDAAVARARAMVASDPQSAGSWLLLAKVDWFRHNPGATETDLLQAIDLDPKRQTAYVELGQVYLAEHLTAQAVEKRAALAGKTPSTRSLMQLGMLHSSAKQFEAARANYEKVLALEPKFGPALINLANLYAEHLEKPDLAFDLAQRARASASGDANAADPLGWILYRQGDLHGALDLVQECAQKDPGDITVQFHLGVIHYMLGEEEPATLAFQRVVAGGGPYPAFMEAAHHKLAFLALDPATASRSVRDDLQKRLTADPKDSILTIKLAQIEAREGAAVEAAGHFETALKLTLGNPQIRLQLAQLYAGPLHDPAKARVLAEGDDEHAHAK